MKNFIFDQLFTLKHLRGKIDRNEIKPIGYILPSIIVILASIGGLVLSTTDATPEPLQTFRFIQTVIATAISLASIYIGFKHIDQPFSWKKAGLALYAVGWRMGVIGFAIFEVSLLVGTILTGSPLDPAGAFIGSQEVLSIEATLAGVLALIIPLSIGYLFRSRSAS